MKAGDIFSKTLPFVWAKLLLGVITVVVSGVVALVLGLFALLFQSAAVGWIMFWVWLAAFGVIRFVLMHYMGYLVKAGHIAVISEAIITGQIPPDQVNYGKAKVTERFVTANVYFGVDKLVGAAVKQIQKGIGKIGDILDFIPGMSAVTGLAQFFVELSLGYIDECCLGYTFYRTDQGAFQASADGVVIYAQNWKTILKNAAKVMVGVILGMVGIFLVLSIVLGLIFVWLFHVPGEIMVVVAILLTLIIKFSFIDSWVLVQTMHAYMNAALTTQIQFDLYGKLCSISGKFKELWNKGQEEGPTPAYATAGAGGWQSGQGAIESQDQPRFDTASSAGGWQGGQAASGAGADVAYADPGDAGAGEKPVFCGQCGASNARGVKFCGKCGAKM
ncbi:MAG: zinc ribbon domain-containing protein [Lachnospiraceae bacterium]|jgi:hypothetical protein|nr:zinc ribbon domain-containing protein [Lachnospiraceae bacterium]